MQILSEAPPDGAALPGSLGQGHSRRPGLDGLRGFALLGMLAWHAQLDWVRGGFARMTIFFVLSGYLAATSMQRLQGRGAGRPVRTFLSRRLRRLLPLTLVGVCAAIAVTAWVGSAAARRSLQGDVLSVLGGVSNWRFIADSRPYGAMFESPSALQHFWSLSAEEQCIYLLPVVMAAVLILARRRAWILLATLSIGLLAIPVFLTQSPDTIYYGTPNRAGEFLAGVALALWMGQHRHRLAARGRQVQAAGFLSLLALVAVMVTVDRATPWLYRGGLALMVIPVVAVVAAVASGDGLTARVLSTKPLATLGRWALSIYVLHWPLYLVMNEGRVGLSGTALAAAQIAAAVCLGGLFYVFVERPLLPQPATRAIGAGPAAGADRSWRRDRVFLPALASGAAALAVAAVMVPVPPPVYDFAAAQAKIEQSSAPAGLSQGGAAASSLSATTAPRVGVFGGSTGVLLGAAMFDWAQEVPDVTPVAAWSRHGCGFLTNGMHLDRYPDGTIEANRPGPDCDDWLQNWTESTERNSVSIGVVVTGVWETSDWIIDGWEGSSTIEVPEFADLVRAQVTTALDALEARGTRVVITTAPNVGPGTTGRARADRGLPVDHPDRVGTYNAILREVAASRPDVAVVDYGSYVDSLAADLSAEWMPDGLHPTDFAARRLWADYLGPELMSAIAALRPDLDGPSPDATA